MVHYGNYIITVGGDRKEREVELLHICSLLWSAVTSLPRPLSRITATLCRDCIIALDYDGSACMIPVQSLTSTTSKEASTEHLQWMSLPNCPVNYGGLPGNPSLTTLNEQPLVISYNGMFQLHNRQWEKIGYMSAPMHYCIVCVVCDEMVVVGGRTYGYPSTLTNAIHVAVIG